jgi:hypothetical protein
MAPERPAGGIDVADDDDETPPGNQRPVRAPPHLVQVIEELVVVGDVAKLARVIVVLLQCPVRRRGQDQVDALVIELQLAAVLVLEDVSSGDGSIAALI